MNPLFKYGLIVSSIGLLLQVFGFVYFFGFFRGSYQQFKETTMESLKRLEGVFFTGVSVVRRDGDEAAAAEPTTVRSKR